MAATRQWICDVCSYIHEGDAPPDECPVCGVGAEFFSPYEEPQREPEAPAVQAWRCTVCEYIHEGQAPPEVCPVCGVDAGLFVAHGEPEAVSTKRADDEPPAGKRIVILGGGVAGLSAAEAARKASDSLHISLVHKEPDPPYSRLNLTRFLAGEVADTKLPLRDADWYATNRITLIHDEAVRIDRVGRRVELRGGDVLEFERLVLASGAHPFVPPILGVTRQGTTSLRTLEDARALLDRAKQGARCAVVGGGLLGLEIAGALTRRGVSVTVLEGFEWLLPRQLARPAGELLAGHVEGLGIEVRCGVRVEEVLGDEEVRAVRLAEGDEIPADALVLATGVRPNSYLARLCGLDVGRGVLVDDAMRTSDPVIFAAGDVTEHRGVVYGLWPTALAQGLIAGRNAAGGEAEFQGMPPATQLKVLDVALFSIGEFNPADGSYRVYEQREDGRYYRFVTRDGTFVGANLFGDTSLAANLKEAIEGRWQLLECRELLDRFPGLFRDG